MRIAGVNQFRGYPKLSQANSPQKTLNTRKRNYVIPFRAFREFRGE
jgi:hypothetical protein